MRHPLSPTQLLRMTRVIDLKCGDARYTWGNITVEMCVVLPFGRRSRSFGVQRVDLPRITVSGLRSSNKTWTIY